MEGTLWKWTNYFSGWQPRWFVLENGILSYYKSQDDVVNGCKGSIKMSVCDVNVHGTDSARLDLIIPGEAHFYVRAATPQERQQWLVALGSAKACLTNGRVSSPTALSVEIPEEQLKAKKSELRLYCDLLMQQVHSVKSAVQTTETPSVSELNEATSLLSATCDTFIHTLEDCMKLSAAQTSLDASPSPDVPTSLSPSKKTSKSVPWALGAAQRSMSVDSPLQNGHSSDELIQGYIPGRGYRGNRIRPGSRSTSESSSSEPKDVRTPPTIQELRESLTRLDAEHTSLPTFISTMPVSFKDVVCDSENGIPTISFLDACKPILPIFDKLNPTAFAPVKLDISGNIGKIQQKFSTDPSRFETLQKLIDFEVSNKQNVNPNSATIALLWLKRGLDFTECFLQEYLAGIDDLTLAANTAYAKTLKQYHGWVMRGVFALAVKAVPTKQEFLHHLAIDAADVDKAAFELSVLRDVDRYVGELSRPLGILRQYYVTHDLDSEEQV